MKADFLHGDPNEPRLILRHLHLDIARQGLANAIQSLLYGVRDGDRIGSGLLLYKEADGVLSIQTAEAPRLLNGIFSDSNVLDTNGVACTICHDEFVKLLGSCDAS